MKEIDGEIVKSKKIKIPKVRLPGVNFKAFKAKGILLFFLNLLLVALPVVSILYLIPDLKIPYQGSVYYFNNFLGTENNEEITVQIPRITNTFAYKLESVTEVENDGDRKRIAAEDLTFLERRARNFVGTNNIEIKREDVSKKVVFTLYSPQNLGSQTEVLVKNNSDFKVSKQVTDANGQSTAGEEIKVARSNFRDAEIKVEQNTSSTSGSQFVYLVRLPLGLTNTDTVKVINENQYDSLNIFIGGKDYSGSFFATTTGGTITHLVISGITNPDEATAVQTYLNTPSYNLGYTVQSSELANQNYGLYKFSALLLLFMLTAIAFAHVFQKSFNIKKVVLFISVLLVALASIKLFNITLTAGIAFFISVITILMLLNARWQFVTGIVVVLILLTVIGKLYFVQLQIRDLVLLIAVLAGYLLIQFFIKKDNEKYN